MRTLILLLVVSALGLVAKADTLPTESDVREFSDGVMAKAGAGDLAGAFAAMKPYTTIPTAEFDAIALTTISQRESLGARYGAAAGHEFIGETKAGAYLLKLTYIEKTDRHTLPWRFYFVRVPNGWVLHAFLWHYRTQTLPGER